MKRAAALLILLLAGCGKPEAKKPDHTASELLELRLEVAELRKEIHENEKRRDEGERLSSGIAKNDDWLSERRLQDIEQKADAQGLTLENLSTQTENGLGKLDRRLEAIELRLK